MGAPIQSQTAPPSSPAPSGGGGGCGHGGGQMAPPPVAPPPVAQPQMSQPPMAQASQPPMAQASQPPQQRSMPSWFTGNSGGTPAISQPSISGAINGGGLPMQAAVLNETSTGNAGTATGRPMPSSWMEAIKGPVMQKGNLGDSVGQSMDLQSLPWGGGGGMMMGPDGQAKAGVMEGGQVMPQTLFSM